MKFEQSSGCGTNCCDPCGTVQLEGCAAGVPYLQLVSIGTGAATTRWVNLDTGDVADAKPAGFQTGPCSAAADNQKTCYSFGADAYTVYTVNAVTTYLKNDVVLTDAADIDAAIVLIATATYENLADCVPEAVVCKAAHYEQLTLVAGVAQTITHTFALTNPLAMSYSVRGVDGGTVGDWPTGVRFISHTATTVDIIADGIGGVVDVALMNIECLNADWTAANGEVPVVTLTGTARGINYWDNFDDGATQADSTQSGADMLSIIPPYPPVSVSVNGGPSIPTAHRNDGPGALAPFPLATNLVAGDVLMVTMQDGTRIAYTLTDVL